MGKKFLIITASVGSGHEKAAGAVIQGDIEQVKQKIMKELKKVLK